MPCLSLGLQNSLGRVAQFVVNAAIRAIGSLYADIWLLPAQAFCQKAIDELKAILCFIPVWTFWRAGCEYLSQ